MGGRRHHEHPTMKNHWNIGEEWPIKKHAELQSL
jgi:hypothetical protein